MTKLSQLSENYRNRLLTRNLYNPENQYDINNPKIIDAINLISNEIINPGNSYDFSNTLYGKILGPQTPLSIIGRNQLILQKSYDVKYKLRNKLVPTIKINSAANSFNNILDFSKNVDYTITKQINESTIDSIRNTVINYTTFGNIINPITAKFSYIDNFIYNSKLLIEYTGDGQLHQLEKNLSTNIFYPEYNIGVKNDVVISNKNLLYNTINSFSTFKEIFNLKEFTFQYVAPTTKEYKINTIDTNYRNDLGGIKTPSQIDDISEQKEKSINDDTSVYGLTAYTKQLFNTLGNKNPNNKKQSQYVDINGNTHYNGSVFNNYNQDDQYGISKVKNPNGYTEKRYEKSVMYNTNQPKIVGNGDENVFFSIENLAVTYNSFKYPLEQKGRFGGRFMWFNPYIVNINETSNPELTTTKFIGRSEPVYTYASNERSLTISFKLMVDYDENLLKVKDYNGYLNYIYRNQINQDFSNTTPKPTNLNKEKVLTENKNQLTKNKVEFKYNLGVIKYQYANDSSIIDYNNNEYKNQVLSMLDSIINYDNINPNSKFKINIISFSSINSDSNYSTQLAENRNNSVIESINYFMISDRNKYSQLLNNIEYSVLTEVNTTQEIPTNYSSPTAKQERTSNILSVVLTSTDIVEKDLTNTNLDEIRKNNEELASTVDNNIEVNNENIINIINSRLTNNFDNIGSGVFNKIKNKIISPGLISYSPRDLYDRLTFLNQCTRQGATIDFDQDTISNSVFGKPPVIVIRIGDMYYSKAMINQLTIDFNEESTWDLNNSGMGVQFMGCDVVLSMKLIGGSSIDGPTKHILNADSRSYYANSSFEQNKIDNIYLDEEQKILKSV